MMGRFVCFMTSTAFSHIGRSKVTIVTLSAEGPIHSLKVVKIVLRSLGSPSMTGRKSICVLCFVSSAWILFIQPFQLECENSQSWALITHPAAQSVSPGAQEWLVMSQIGGELSNWQKHDGVYSCLFALVNGRFFTSGPLRILALSSTFNFTLGTDSSCCLWI